MAIQRPSYTLRDLAAQHPATLDPAKLFTNPKGFLSDVNKEIQKIYAQAQKNFTDFRSSPLEGVRRLWTYIVGNPSNLATKVGIATNILVAAGTFMGSPIMITLSLIGSTAAHILNGETVKYAEMLEKLLGEFKKANLELEASIKNFKKENETLRASNEELKRNIADLKRNIRVLETHLGTLQQCNNTFKLNLTELNRCIEEFKAANGRAGARVESIAGLERSFQLIKAEITSFSTRLDDTQTILRTHTQDFAAQMGTLTDTMRIVHERLPELTRIQGLSIVCGQFNLALEGMRKHQDEIKSTNEELQRAQRKCADEHNQLKATRLACETMLAKFERMFGEKAKTTNQTTAQRVQTSASVARVLPRAVRAG